MFLRGPGILDAPTDLGEIVSFLAPVIAALTQNQPFDFAWKPPGPWLRRGG